MGNSLNCSASGERLVSAARDGDLVEARMLLQFNPALAKYSTFGGLNSPLHFAASKGHHEIVALLLERGADVNARNYCGQTALMQACRYGHWEVVQTLLIYRANVTRADYLSGRTALHLAALEGHVRCIRLLVADFIPSAPFEAIPFLKDSSVDKGSSRGSSPDRNKYDQFALLKFVNKSADGGLNALHMAALNGHFDCVHLLLDLGANVAAITFHYGTSMNLIGSGSTALHYSACGGDLKCCQMLLARGASRLTLNCNGWLPIDVAKIWSRHWLEPLLSPNSNLAIPAFPFSDYLSLPLMSILNIAREYGLQSSTTHTDDADLCAVCLEKTCNVAAEGCAHELCVKCALYLCSTSNVQSEAVNPPGSIPCPLCRNGIVSFVKLPSTPDREIKSNLALGFCNPCVLKPCTTDMPTTGTRSENRRNRMAAVSSELICPHACGPFPYAVIPYCTCDDDTSTTEEMNAESEPQSPRNSQGAPEELVNMEEERDDITSCSGIFWSGRRSSHREHQCDLEINA